jgi:hypothetical protein
MKWEALTSAASRQSCRASLDRADGGVRPYVFCGALRGFAWGFGFEGFLRAHVDLDLLGLGFRLLG